MPVQLEERPSWDLSEPPPPRGSWRHLLVTLLFMGAFFGGVVGAFVLLGHLSAASAAGNCGGG